MPFSIKISVTDNLSYTLNKNKYFNFVKGIDFDLLKGTSLRRYKTENGMEKL